MQYMVAGTDVFMVRKISVNCEQMMAVSLKTKAGPNLWPCPGSFCQKIDYKGSIG